MSRRQRHEECPEEGGAWEIALADLMTTLMVFFLVMWLTSIVDPDKRKAFVEALVGEGAGGENISADETNTPREPSIMKEDLKPVSTEEIQQAMSKVNPKDIDIEDTPEYTKITLRSDSFFESGRATITDKTREQLEQLGETLAGRDQEITITGYTDSIPIENLQFPSNWELSAARAATVARTFIYMGVDKNLVTISGKADNDAVAPNATAYGRSLNRRVIILVNKQSQKQRSAQPQSPKPTFDYRYQQ
ncbi:Motility protein B [Hydrogenovibrio crunogenus]|uniref:Motility protein B n=1 Tax=Hydrogenovibrio crunogenus TaxID=39765 RepID=A0A4P7NX80_9GAMM|nr:flagellar motor protein MotB [Hydrogenovibrio crunogenus]QBZ82351.1 Motility protein B [Hydrogenovibrio crunogenus]RUM91594.1 MAG: cell envelope biogenesis protein OmpA [Thiomicrospira sp.]